MKNSFIITTGGVKTNFDKLYKQMLIRKKILLPPSVNNSATDIDFRPETNLYGQPKAKEIITMNKGRRPAARDGHTGVFIQNKFMLVFGGDRHRMPFNDLYVLDL